MRYQIGGNLRSKDLTYVVREADEKLYVELKAGNFCYVFNSRQMGKSSLLQRIIHRLEQEGCAYVHLDVSQLGSEGTTPMPWYEDKGGWHSQRNQQLGTDISAFLSQGGTETEEDSLADTPLRCKFHQLRKMCQEL